MGPASYTVAASDLKAKSKEVKMFKFADDTSLVTAGKHYAKVKDELEQIEAWAQSNNLQLNKSKTFEIVFFKKNCKKKRFPPEATPGIKRVNSIKLLGVTLQNNLSMDEHIGNVLSECATNLYALYTLKAHGLHERELCETYRAKILSKILYASPAWWGYCNSDSCNRINSFLNKSKKFGFYSQDGDLFEMLCQAADDNLFAKVKNNPEYVLHPLCQRPRPIIMICVIESMTLSCQSMTTEIFSLEFYLKTCIN